MKRIVAMIVVGCFASSLVLAAGPITSADVEAASKAVAAESVAADQPDPERAPNAPTGMSSGAWTAILLAVIVVGGALYLADKNDADHGGGGIFSAQRARGSQPREFRGGLLRPQWAAR